MHIRATVLILATLALSVSCVTHTTTSVEETSRTTSSTASGVTTPSALSSHPGTSLGETVHESSTVKTSAFSSMTTSFEKPNVTNSSNHTFSNPETRPANTSFATTASPISPPCDFGFRRDASGTCQLRISVVLRYDETVASLQQDLAAVLLAITHYNEKNNSIITLLPSGPKVVVDFYNTNIGKNASQVCNDLSTNGSAAVLGPVQAENVAFCQYYIKSVPIGEIAWRPTASYLDDIYNYPYFCRNVPSDSVIASLTAKFIANLSVKRVGFLYENQAGSSFLDSFRLAASSEGVQIVSALNGTSESEIRQAVRGLHKRKVHYVVSTLAGPPSSSAEIAMDEAVKIGMIGPGYAWIFTGDADPLAMFVGRRDQMFIMNGTFKIESTPPSGPKWETLKKILHTSAGDKITAPLGINITFAAASLADLRPSAGYAYDAAMIALTSIANTYTSGPPDGRAIFSMMQKSSISGVTGLNRMNELGSRDVETFTAAVYNYYASPGMNINQTLSFTQVAHLQDNIYSSDASLLHWNGGPRPVDGSECTKDSYFNEERTRCEFRIGVMGDLTDGPDPSPVRFSAQHLAGLLLAVEHVNARNYTHVQISRPLNLDLFLEPVFFDTNSSPAGAMAALKRLWSSNDEISSKTFIDVYTPAILGPELDAVAQPLQLLTNIQDTIMMSYVPGISVSSSEPLYISSVPYLKYTAFATAELVYHFGWRRVGILLSNGQNNVEFQLQFASVYTSIDIAVVAQFDPTSNSSVSDACARLKTANVRVIIAVFSPSVNIPNLMATAETYEIIGSGFAWVIQSDEELENILARAPNPQKTAALLHGAFRLRFSPTSLREREWAALQTEIENLDLNLVNRHAPVQISRGVLAPPFSSSVATAYDSVWLLAGALSDMMNSGEKFSGAAIMTKLKNTIYEGVTGKVVINPDDFNSRNANTMNVDVENWIISASPTKSSSLRNSDEKIAARSVVGRNITERVIFVWNSTSGLTPMRGTNVTFSNSGPTPPLDGSGCGGGARFDPVSMACVQCEAGTSSAGQNLIATECPPCLPGTFSPEAGLSKCIPCSSVGEFTNKTGSQECEKCPETTEGQVGSLGLSVAECLCVAGYYSPDGTPGTTCEKCPEGGVCAGKLEMPTPSLFYWGDVDFPTEFFICETTYNCLGNYECARGFTERLCVECADDYFAIGKKCFECPEGDVRRIVVTVSCIIGVILLFITVNTLANFAEPLDILLLFMQIQQLIQTFDLNWPAEADTLNTIFYLFNFNIDVISPACVYGGWGYSKSFALQLLLPIVDLVLCIFVFGGGKLILHLTQTRKFKIKFGPKSEEKLEKLRDVLIEHWLSFLVSSYNVLAQSSFETFFCRRLASGEKMLLASPAFDCDTPAHTGHIVASVFSIIFYVIGVPAAIFYILFFVGHRRGQLNDPQYLRRFGWLYQRYQPKYFFWELVVTARRLSICIVITLIRFDKYVQALLGIVILLACLAADFLTAPFVDWKLNLLDCAGLSVCLLYVFCGVLFDAGFVYQTELFWILVGLLIIVILFGISITIKDFDEKKALFIALKTMAERCGRAMEVSRKDFARRNFTVFVENVEEKSDSSSDGGGKSGGKIKSKKKRVLATDVEMESFGGGNLNGIPTPLSPTSRKKFTTEASEQWKLELAATLRRLNIDHDFPGLSLEEKEAKYNEVRETYMLKAAINRISWESPIGLTQKRSEVSNTFAADKLAHWAEHEHDSRMFSLLYACETFLKTFVSDESETAHSNHSHLSDFLWKLCSSFPFILDWALQASPTEHRHFSKWVESMVEIREAVGKEGLYSPYVVDIDKGSVLMWLTRNAEMEEINIVKELLTRIVSTETSTEMKILRNKYPLVIDKKDDDATAGSVVANLIMFGANKTVKKLLQKSSSKREMDDDVREIEERALEILRSTVSPLPVETASPRSEGAGVSDEKTGRPKRGPILDVAAKRGDDTEFDPTESSSPPSSAPLAFRPFPTILSPSRFSFDNNKTPSRSALKSAFPPPTPAAARTTAMEKPAKLRGHASDSDESDDDLSGHSPQRNPKPNLFFHEIETQDADTRLVDSAILNALNPKSPDKKSPHRPHPLNQASPRELTISPVARASPTASTTTKAAATMPSPRSWRFWSAETRLADIDLVPDALAGETELVERLPAPAPIPKHRACFTGNFFSV